METRRRRVGVVDIGSNSVRLVVYDRLRRAPFPVFNERVLCGLGRDLAVTGRLSEDGVTLALDAIARYASLAKAMGVAWLHGLATAAVRDASDGPAFVDTVQRRTGLEVRVITGELEARFSALGVLSSTPAADGIMGDLGGGSLELVAIDNGTLGPGTTLPIGSLRVIAASRGATGRARAIVKAELERVPWLERVSGRTFYAVGGAWRSLGRLHMTEGKYPLGIIDHYSLPLDEAEVLVERVRRGRGRMAKMLRDLPRRRRETLPFAALILQRLLAVGRPREVMFSGQGIREGYLFHRLSRAARNDDPLICACADIAARRSRFGMHREDMLGWMAPLFHGERPADERLRLAACLLGDLAWNDHPEQRAEQAFDEILRLPIMGVDHPDRAFLALAVYIRYGGNLNGAPVDRVKPLLREARIAVARLLGLALRLGFTLVGGVPGLIGATALELDGEVLRLRLPVELGELSGEAVSRRLDALSQALNRRSEVTVAEAVLAASA